MPNPTEVTRDFTVGVAAQALKLSEDTVRRDIRRGAPHDKSGGEIRVNIEELSAFREERSLTGKRGRPKPEDPAELAAAKLAKLLQEVRIKRAQADRDERRAQVERGTHQSLNELREMLTVAGSALRSGVDRMQRRFGPEVATAFNEVLDECDAVVRKHLGGVVPAVAGGAGEAAAEPAGVR